MGVCERFPKGLSALLLCGAVCCVSGLAAAATLEPAEQSKYQRLVEVACEGEALDQLWAARALRALKTPWALNQLEHLAKSADLDVRLEALLTLTEQGREEYEAEAAQACREAVERGGVGRIRLAWRLGAREEIPYLTKVGLETTDESELLAAVWTLARLAGVDKAEAVLGERVEDHSAAKAVLQCAKYAEPGRPIGWGDREWLILTSLTSPPTVRKYCLKTVAEWQSTASAVPTVGYGVFGELLFDGELETRCSAALGLVCTNWSSAIDLLRKALQREETVAGKACAAAAILSLADLQVENEPTSLCFGIPGLSPRGVLAILLAGEACVRLASYMQEPEHFLIAAASVLSPQEREWLEAAGLQVEEFVSRLERVVESREFAQRSREELEELADTCATYGLDEGVLDMFARLEHPQSHAGSVFVSDRGRVAGDFAWRQYEQETGQAPTLLQMMVLTLERIPEKQREVYLPEGTTWEGIRPVVKWRHRTED